VEDTLPRVLSVKQATGHTCWLAQNTLLGERGDMDSIVAAVRKIQQEWA